MRSAVDRLEKEERAEGRRSLLADRLVVAGFLVLLALPLAELGLRLDPTAAAVENRKAAPAPGLPGSLGELGRWPRAFDAWFDDHFGFRNLLLRTRLRATQLLTGSSGVDWVLRGRDGWLFMDGAQIESWKAAKPFPAADRELWLEVMARRREWLAGLGIRMVALVAPNKATIYPEFLPESVKRVSDVTRLDELLRRAGDRGDVEVLDLRPALRAAKGAGLVYARTDTHWNARGAAVACGLVVDRVREWFPSVPVLGLVELSFRDVEGPGGDLARGAGLEATMREPWPVPQPAMPRAAVAMPTSELRTRPTFRGWELEDLQLAAYEIPGSRWPRAMLFGDSFMEPMVPLLADRFSRFVAVRSRIPDPELILRERPDVVIFEMVERVLMETALVDPAVIGSRAEQADFDASGQVLLRRGGEAGLAGFSALIQTRLEERDGALRIENQGTSAYFELAVGPGTEPLPPGSVLRLEIESPADDIAFVSFRGPGARAWGGSVSLATMAGVHPVYLRLPGPDPVERIRIRVGTVPATYWLRAVEVRAAAGGSSLRR